MFTRVSMSKIKNKSPFSTLKCRIALDLAFHLDELAMFNFYKVFLHYRINSRHWWLRISVDNIKEKRMSRIACAGRKTTSGHHGTSRATTRRGALSAQQDAMFKAGPCARGEMCLKLICCKWYATPAGPANGTIIGYINNDRRNDPSPCADVP